MVLLCCEISIRKLKEKDIEGKVSPKGKHMPFIIMVLADMQFAEKVNKILSIIVKKLVSLSKKYCEKRKIMVK